MAPIDLLGSDSKRSLLLLMKRRGDVSLDDAVEATGLARTTLREHLTALERDGLVERRTRRQGRGRPSLRYRLAAAGDRLFPARDGVLLREMIAFLDREDQTDLVERFFSQYWEHRTREVQNRLAAVEPGDVSTRLEVLRRVLQEQGFMPEIETVGEEVVIRECNCPFPEAVRATRLPCRLEARFFERVLRDEIRRVSYIPEGHAACTYTFPGPGEDGQAA